MKKIISLTFSVALLVGIVYTLTSGGGTAPGSKASNITMDNSTQIITIMANNGYTPTTTTAQAGIPTELIIQTNGTYDCSRSLFIDSLNYRVLLPANGEQQLNIGTPKAGDVIQGVCGMGMYRFKVEFSDT